MTHNWLRSRLSWTGVSLLLLTAVTTQMGCGTTTTTTARVTLPPTTTTTSVVAIERHFMLNLASDIREFTKLFSSTQADDATELRQKAGIITLLLESALRMEAPSTRTEDVRAEWAATLAAYREGFGALLVQDKASAAWILSSAELVDHRNRLATMILELARDMDLAELMSMLATTSTTQ